MNEHKTLEGFVTYYQTAGFNPLPWKTYHYGPVHSLVLYRDSPFQAELFILDPGVVFPRQHRHPDVDSYEYIVSEHVPLIINGRDVSRIGTVGDVTNYGAKYQVRSTDWHGVGDVPKGGAFMSFQMWKNGREPTSVGKNWQGAPVSEIHKALLREPDSVWVKTTERQSSPEMIAGISASY